MAGNNEIKNIFLSASIPLQERDPQYIETADIIAIRDAVIALTTVVLPRYRLIWGGHPSITPLIYHVMEKLKLNIQEHVILYQSRFFEKYFPKDNNKFKNIVLTDIIDDDRGCSLLHMRQRMLDDFEFAAGIFIGGMEGVEEEYDMFIKKHHNAIILPIASTGAAARKIYDERFTDKNERLVKDYAYMSLFQKYLIDKI
ncbi:SLOG domain-containing protein [Prevotella sp.]